MLAQDSNLLNKPPWGGEPGSTCRDVRGMYTLTNVVNWASRGGVHFPSLTPLSGQRKNLDMEPVYRRTLRVHAAYSGTQLYGLVTETYLYRQLAVGC